MNKPFDFGSVLRDLRKQKGYTQKRLAEILNVSETMISKYESNTASPPFETFRAIAIWFNVSADILIGNESNSVIPLYGLTSEQTEILKQLSALFNKKNTSVKSDVKEEYELLGRLISVLIK